jgi:hypothetical protein
MNELKHKVGGYVNDYTRKKIEQIEQIVPSSPPSYDMGYGLVFKDNAFTHFLSVEELDRLYPYLGDNKQALEILYGAQLPKGYSK